MSDEPVFPLKDFLGFTIDQGEGSAIATLDIDERHLNPNGISHGATHFTLMDTAMGAAVMSIVGPDQLCATIEIHTRFHRPVQQGRVTAEATVLTAGRRIVHLEAKVVNGDGDLVASATGSFAIISGQ